MAITTLCETFGRRYTSHTTGKETAVRVYMAISNANITDLDDVVTDALAAGLPALGDSYSGSAPTLVVTQHVPREMDMEKAFYNIEVIYESDWIGWATPTNRGWVIEFDSILEEYAPSGTYYNTAFAAGGSTVGVAGGARIINKAGFPFDPTVVTTDALVSIRLNKNFASVSAIGDSTITNIDELMSVVNTVNSDAVTIAGISGTQSQFWCESINIRNVTENGSDYYATNFNIIYNPSGHYQEILNAGWHDKNGDEIKGDNGGEIGNPWPLDVNGDPIKGGAAVREANAIYLALGLHSQFAFVGLGLPTTFP